jgi:hypothetical protein
VVEAPVEVQSAAVEEEASMEVQVEVAAVALTAAEEEVVVVAEAEEAPTNSFGFRIVERVAGSHLDLRQDGP